MMNADRVATDAGTAIVGLSTAFGLNLSWLDLLNYSYSGLMGIGALLLMIGRLVLMWREVKAKRRAAEARE